MFRFSIRDVLWLMVVVGLGVCWLQTAKKKGYLEEQNQNLSEQNKNLTDIIWAPGMNFSPEAKAESIWFQTRTLP